MSTDLPSPVAAAGASWSDAIIGWNRAWPRVLVIAAGVLSSVLFVAIGLRDQLQMFADGSIFSYSVAVQDAWAFHWHNISGRLFVYLFSYLPAEAYVALTGDARGGITAYGLLFFGAQLLGLLATWAADRSQGSVIFRYACLSTACLCPLVFGFPTEMWMAHALFWPTLAVCHYARAGIKGAILVFALMLALVFTHEGALIFAAAILMTLLLRGLRDGAFLRAACALLAVASIWAVIKAMFPPDAYIAPVLRDAALHVFEPAILTDNLMLLLFATLASYLVAFLILRRLAVAKAHLYAASIIALALAVYWRWFDQALHASSRYHLRSVLMIATPLLGGLAAVSAVAGEGRLNLPMPFLPGLAQALSKSVTARAAAGAVLLVMLVHAVETTKFVEAWTSYLAAVRTLAAGTASDPPLGDPRFVSSDRIAAGLSRLSWSSTTPFLSVLVAPRFAPARLVVDPGAAYFWLPCATAKANENADRAIPFESRRLVRVYSCLHR